MINKNWEIVVESSCLIGEGPVWDRRNKCIYWVDIPQCEIYQFFPMQNKSRTYKTDNMVGSFALRASGGIIAALKNGFAIIDLDNETTQLLTDPEAYIKNNRFNDGKCDPAGRYWAGTMDMSGRPNAGGLYMLESNHLASIKIKDVSCSNGLAWSADNSTFYYIDTPTRQVAAYDYEITNGNITNKRILVTFPEDEGYPDGMTIDSEGMLWVALWDGWKVVRLNTKTGEIIDKFFLPVSKVTSCTFGGETLEDLYITSAKSGLTDIELTEQPLAGSLFVIRNCGFKGLDAFEYIG